MVRWSPPGSLPSRVIRAGPHPDRRRRAARATRQTSCALLLARWPAPAGQKKRRVDGARMTDPVPVGDATRDRTLLFEGVFDLFPGVLEVAFGLVALAFGFEGFVVGRFAELFLNFAGSFLGGVFGLVLCAHRVTCFFSWWSGSA